MKTIAAISALLLSACVWSDGQAPVTFSGKGKGGIEVRDASGQVTEVRGHSDLRLNQIPADAAAREEAAGAKRKERAQNNAAVRSEKEAMAEEELKAAGEAAAGEAKATEEAAAQAEQAAALEEAQHPRKIRGKTVRGTRFVENPVIEPETPAAPQGPVLSATGQKKTPEADSPDTP